MMKQTKFLALFLALAILLSSFLSCQQPKPDSNTDSTGKTEEMTGSVTYELSVKNNNPHTTLQTEYLKSRKFTILPDDVDGKDERSRPEPITLKWTAKLDGINTSSLKESVVISEDKDFTNPIRIEPGSRSVQIYNLEVGQTLYWCVEGKAAGQVFKSDTATFTVTNSAPRNLYVSGVTNCRDLGGWKAEDGTYLKQGQIFRTGRLSNTTKDGRKTLNDSSFSIFEDSGTTILVKNLGVTTEIDIRLEDQVAKHGDTTEKSAAGIKNYYFLPMEWENLSPYNILTAPQNNESLLKVFEIFGDESNYPILFHCSIGTDRTGLISFLILGLCGVSEPDLYRDFLFSGYGKIDKRPSTDALDKYIQTVEVSAGSTLSEKIENYLLDRGVTAEQIATIRKMMK